MALSGKAKTDYQREYMRKRRLMYGNGNGNGHNYKRRTGICEVCGFSRTIGLHHDGDARVEHVLCPNHHALITRGLTTLLDLTQDSVRPIATPIVIPGVDNTIEDSSSPSDIEYIDADGCPVYGV